MEDKIGRRVKTCIYAYAHIAVWQRQPFNHHEQVFTDPRRRHRRHHDGEPLAPLPVFEWRMTVVDRSDKHLYQPGFLFLPFGKYEGERHHPADARFHSA